MQGAQLGIDCNNSGMQFSVGVSTQTRADVMPSLDEVEDGRPWMLADASAVCSSSLLEAELSYMTAGLGLQLVKAAVVHLADGATAITGEQDAPPPTPRRARPPARPRPFPQHTCVAALLLSCADRHCARWVLAMPQSHSATNTAAIRHLICSVHEPRGGRLQHHEMPAAPLVRRLLGAAAGQGACRLQEQPH